MSSVSGSREVTIRTVQCLCHGEYLKIEPAIHRMVPVVKTAHAQLVTSRTQGSQLQLDETTLCPHPTIQRSLVEQSGRQRDDEFTATYVGLEAVVRRQLRDAGFGGTVQPRRTSRLPEPDLAGLDGFAAVDTGMLQFIRENDRGLIRCGKGLDLGTLVAQVALAYPTASIAVPLLTKRRAIAMAATVRSFFPDAVCFLEHGVESYEYPRVIITLPGRLSYGDVSIQKRDILLLPAALQMLNRRPLEGLKRAFHAHVIGFLPMDAKLSNSEWDALRCWYGFAEFTLPAHGRQMLPVDVVQVPFRQRPRTDASATVLDVKRQEIWQHPVRNRMVCKYAKLLNAGQDMPGDSQLPGLTAKPMRVAVLVEGVEHAAELLKGLPDWPLITLGEVNMHGLQPGQIGRLEAARRVLPVGKVVITHASAHQVDFSRFDALLRADGGTGLPALHPTSIDVQDQQRLLLLDFADRHHPLCRQWSRTRRDQYAKAGWYPLGADPATERVSQFLHSRCKE